MRTIKKDSTKFTVFLSSEYLLVLFCLVTTIVVYSPKLRYYSYGIDTERMIAEPSQTLSWWLSLNRYGLVFLKTILPYGTTIYPTFVNICTYLLFAFSIILLCYLAWRTKKINSKYVYFIGSFLAITSPTIIEQTNFILQSIEVQIAVILQILAVLLIQISSELNNNIKKIGYLSFSILISAFSFSVYQSLLVSFCVLAIISIYFTTDSKTKFYDFFRKTLAYIFVLGISVSLYWITNKLIYQVFNVSNVGYITTEFYFLKVPFKQYLAEVNQLIQNTFFSFENRFFLWIPTLYLIVFLLSFLSNRNNTIQRKISLFFLIVGLSISLSFLILTLGWSGPMRSYYPTISFSLFFISIAIFNELKLTIIKFMVLSISIFLSISQGLFTYRLAQTTNIIYHEEVMIFTKIKEEFKNLNILSTKNYQLVVYGGVDFSYLNVKKGEMIGTSFFNYDTGYLIGNSQRVADFFVSEGLPVKFINDSKKYKELAHITEVMPNYPNQGFIKIYGNYIILKLN